MAWAHLEGPGAPDTACDLVTAAIADEYLRRDPASLLNIRVSGGHGVLFVAGEAKSQADFDVAAVVRRTLGQIDAGLSAEPFIAIEPMIDPPLFGDRDPLTVFGYATSETESRLPREVERARHILQAIEVRRLMDADWYWLGSDYAVFAGGSRGKEVLIRLGHADMASPEEIKSRLLRVLPEVEANELRVVVAHAKANGGLASRIGSSGRRLSPYGRKLPPTPSGNGHHLAHPSNLGAWYARAAARELVAGGFGKAVLAELDYTPHESKPSAMRVRNEKGEDLRSHLDLSRFDLEHPPVGWDSPKLLVESIRVSFDSTLRLPWEL
jgi:S-adenosylmethionine synthetase